MDTVPCSCLYDSMGDGKSETGCRRNGSSRIGPRKWSRSGVSILKYEDFKGVEMRRNAAKRTVRIDARIRERLRNETMDVQHHIRHHLL